MFFWLQIPEKLKVIVRQLRDFRNWMKNILLYWVYDPLEYILFEKEKLIYIAISKCGNSSIKKSLAYLVIGDKSQEIKDDDSVHYKVNFRKLPRLSDDYLNGEYTIFTCIRDPLDRLKSCYKSKFFYDAEKIKEWKTVQKWLYLENYLFWYLRVPPISFQDFLSKIFRIPNFLQDRHFRSYYECIWWKKVLNKTYFFLLEDAENWFEPIRRKFWLPKLQKQNATSKNNINDSLSDYFIKKSKKIYKKDFHLYEQIRENGPGYIMWE